MKYFTNLQRRWHVTFDYEVRRRCLMMARFCDKTKHYIITLLIEEPCIESDLNAYGVSLPGIKRPGCGVNRLKPNDPYMGRTAPLNSKRRILYIYSTNIGTEYFKHALYSSFFSLQNAICFIMLTCLIPVLFTFHI